MRVPAPARAVVWRTGRRAVDWSARKLKLASYVPFYDYREQLNLHTTFHRDARRVRDKRPSTVDDSNFDLTLTVEGLEDVLAGRDWSGKRVLEVGPKHGTHALWIDEHLRPSELVFSRLRLRPAPPRTSGRDSCARRTAGSTATCARPPSCTSSSRSTLVFFLGVLYHSAFHLPLLGMLNRVTRLGGEMLLETTIDPRPDAAVRIRWQQGTGKAKAVPTLDALRIELAWTGWRDVTWFTDYRPESSEVVLLCRKTDDLGDGADVVDVVTPQRQPA